jgi:hypothetical protein
VAETDSLIIRQVEGSNPSRPTYLLVDVVTNRLSHSPLPRWGSCGIPSIWHSPTARHAGRSFAPNRSRSRQACARLAVW